MGLRPVTVAGIGSTPFGKLEGRSVIDLACEACRQAIADAHISKETIEALFLGNYSAGILLGQETLAPKIACHSGLRGIAVTRVEGACASGGIAFRQAFLLIALGHIDAALVVGAEKMSEAATEKVTRALAAAADDLENRCGLTYPGIFGIYANRHMYEFGTTRRQLALVSVKNKNNGMKNPRAHFRQAVSAEQIMASRLIADPLRLYDCCPISDGAAALVLCASETAGDFTDKRVDVVGSGQALGTINTYEAESLTTFSATVRAASQAFEMSGLSPADIDVAELHDCFTIAEIIDSEDLGFFEKGKAAAAVEEGATQPEGRIPINPSGGLLAKGHPIGATGCGQIYEVVKQLRAEHENQVKEAEFGLAHNLGGTGSVATVHIFQRKW